MHINTHAKTWVPSNGIFNTRTDRLDCIFSTENPKRFWHMKPLWNNLVTCGVGVVCMCHVPCATVISIRVHLCMCDAWSGVRQHDEYDWGTMFQTWWEPYREFQSDWWINTTHTQYDPFCKFAQFVGAFNIPAIAEHPIPSPRQISKFQRRHCGRQAWLSRVMSRSGIRSAVHVRVRVVHPFWRSYTGEYACMWILFITFNSRDVLHIYKAQCVCRRPSLTLIWEA